jgi:hypothetical protein
MIVSLGVMPACASQSSGNVLSELLKSSIHRMVVEVKATPEANSKRKIIGQYLLGMEKGLVKMKDNGKITASDKISVSGLEQRFHTHVSELYGYEGHVPVTDSELDAYAGYLQQNFEQASPIMNGGVYLSTGALLILIILLVIFH